MDREGLEAMDAPVKRLVLSGYYGFRNSGDEAVLKSILLALDEAGQAARMRIEPIVLSAAPDETREMYGVEAVHRMRFAEVRRAIAASDGLISGGGSLLQDATGWKTIPYYLAVAKLAQWAGKPVFIYSQGIGPVRRPVFRPLIRHVFERAVYISVRDPESAQLLEQIGLEPALVEIVPDPVMGLTASVTGEDSPGPAGSAADEPIIGISVRFWNADRSELDRLADALRLFCRGRRLHLRFLPFHHPADAEASHYVAERLGADRGECTISHAETHPDPQQMMREVGRCTMLIGMRLHSLIYAAAQVVPMLGISYDPKIDQFLQQLHMRASGSTDRLDPQSFAQEAALLLEQRERWRAEKSSLIAELKRQSTRPAQQIARELRLQ